MDESITGRPETMYPVKVLAHPARVLVYLVRVLLHPVKEVLKSSSKNVYIFLAFFKMVTQNQKE